MRRLEKELAERKIPVFAKFDHARNAREAGLELRPTTVLVFGSPKVGTGLMQADQSVALELSLRIAIWQDEAGSTWLGCPVWSGWPPTTACRTTRLYPSCSACWKNGAPGGRRLLKPKDAALA